VRRLAGTSLSRRLGLTLLLAGLLQLAVVAAALVLAEQVRSGQTRLTTDYFATVQESHEGFVRFLDLQAAAGAYLRRGDVTDLQRARALEQPAAGAATLEVLQQRLRDDPEALRALDVVAQEYFTWVGQLEAALQTAEAQGTGAATAQDLAALDLRYLSVRDLYDDYVDAVVAARDAAADRLQDLQDLLLLAVLLAVATAVVTGGLLYAALRSWIVVPVSSLAAETRTVRAGDLDHRVDVDGPPEIRQLAADVDAMRRGLVEQLAEVDRARALLEQQAEDLRRSNRDLEQFAYVASHDLQEPLRKVSSFCQMLERRYKGQLDERADQYIEFAVDGAKRMQLLINDLLAFSRVGRITEGAVEVPLGDVVADALRNLAASVEETGATVEASDLPVVRGERRLLVQLVQNLVGNALKFHGERPPRVRITARRVEDDWEVAISDEGIGIDPHFAERIFVIFQRLHPKAEYEGTGIGLALCKKIVEHHGGAIWLDTTVERGTTFRFTLPVEPRTPTTIEALEGAGQEAAWTATSR
jgi:signal transduction histidine kinase